MALDRRITVRIGVAGSGRDVFGEDVETTEYTDYPLWAERAGAGSIDQSTGGGVIVLAARRYTVRYFKELALANIQDVGVIDEFGHATGTPRTSTESDARRRLDLYRNRATGLYVMVALLGGRASGGSVTVRGGNKLRKFITDFRGLSNKRVAQIMARILRSVLLPALRGKAIVRTGALQRSLKIVQRGEGDDTWKGYFMAGLPGTKETNKSVVDHAMDEILESRRNEIRERLKDGNSSGAKHMKNWFKRGGLEKRDSSYTDALVSGDHVSERMAARLRPSRQRPPPLRLARALWAARLPVPWSRVIAAWVAYWTRRCFRWLAGR